MIAGGEVKSLGTFLLDIKSLKIPDFQRNYSWEDRNIDDFHLDIIQSSKFRKAHFMGAAILLSQTETSEIGKSFEVIDGQQRLTTIFMYLSILRDFAASLETNTIPAPSELGSDIHVISEISKVLFSVPKEGTPRFQANRLVQKMFDDCILRNPKGRPKLPPKDAPHTRALRRAHKRINEKIEDHLKEKSEFDKLNAIYALFEALTFNFKILAVTTNSYPESFDVFMTLNNRGKNLEPADLVKSIFMKYLTQDEKDVRKLIEINKNISEEWDEIGKNLGDTGDINQYLRHLLVSKQKFPVQEKGIYIKVQELIDNEVESKRSDYARIFLNEIKESSIYYGELLYPEELKDKQIRRSASTLANVLDTYRIFLYRVINPHTNLNLAERRELARLCEVLAIRWNLTNGGRQDLENLFQELSLILLKNEDVFNKAHTKILDNIPPDSKVKSAFSMDADNTNLVRVIFYRFNLLLGDESELVNYAPKNLHVEHIAPQTPTEQWKNVFFQAQKMEDVLGEYSSISEMWGNKTILEGNINSEVKQKIFKEKVAADPTHEWSGYSSSILAVTRDLQNIPDWNLDIIKNRNLWISEMFRLVWSTNNESQKVVPYSKWSTENPPQRG